jgi:hypothetical protein
MYFAQVHGPREGGSLGEITTRKGPREQLILLLAGGLLRHLNRSSTGSTSIISVAVIRGGPPGPAGSEEAN